MSRPFDEDENASLRAAFQQAVETASAEDVDVDRIWRAVSGELSPEERRDVVERVAADPSWALAWRAAHELWTASGEAPAPRRVQPRWSSRRNVVGLAAALLVAVGIGVFLRPAPPPPVYRGETASVASLVPEGQPLARRPCVLRWSGPTGAIYDLRVLSEDMSLVHAAPALERGEYQVPEAFLSKLPSGARLLWQVGVRLPDGTTRAGPTFVNTLE